MTARFPHHYRVALGWEGEHQAALTADQRPALLGGPPPEFGGKGTWWSPEHLLVAAAELCLMTTFLAYAEREHLAIRGYQSSGEGVVDKTHEGLAVSFMVLDVEVKVAASGVPHAADLMSKAKDHCIVSKSLKCPVELKLRLTVA